MRATLTFVAVLAAAILSSRAAATTFTVTNLADAGAGSLRKAMNDAINHPGPDVVDFTPGLSGTITIGSQLPTIGGVATAAQTEIHGEMATITIDGAGGGFDCFRVAIFANDCVIRGLTVKRCVNGLVVFGDPVDGPFNLQIGGGAAGHRMVFRENTTGIRLGSDLNNMRIVNTQAVSNVQNGMWLSDGARELTVGGPGALEYCVLSGNGFNGILMQSTDGTISDNVIRNNRIGVASDGVTILANGLNGIRMDGTAGGLITTNQVIENTISGNARDGILLMGNVDANTFAGNYVGTDVTGSIDVGNGFNGVRIQDGAQMNQFQHPTVSGTRPNVSSGNAWNGFDITDPDTDHNLVDGCYIGVDATGGTFLKNDQDGVVLHDENVVGPQYNEVKRCVISGNGYNGVHLAEGSLRTTVRECVIGLDVSGGYLLPNGLIPTMGGVAIGGTPGGNPGVGGGSIFNLVTLNTIGGHANYTDHFGVGIFCTSHDNMISKNKIGTDPAGMSARPNQYGIFIQVASSNTVDANQVSYNLSHGIVSAGDNNIFTGNFIGTDATAAVPAQGNGGSGIYVAAFDNVIGGLRSLGDGNTIADNRHWGIEAHGPGAGSYPSVLIRGNDIGVNRIGGAQGNRQGGVWIGHAFRGCVIGDDLSLSLGGDAANQIAHNGGDPSTAQAGVLVGEPDTGAGEPDDPYGNLILTNGIYDNAGEGISIDYYVGDEGNRNIAKPTVTLAVPTLVKGGTNLPAAPVPVVQVFMDSGDEGQTYLGQATVTGVTWTFTPSSSLPVGAHITATNTAAISGDDHTSEFSAPLVVTAVSAVPDPLVHAQPSQFRVLVSPNPSWARATITMDLPKSSFVRVAIYDAAGRELRVLAEKEFPSGRHQINWDGTDGRGRLLARGVFFADVRTGSAHQTRRIIRG